MILEINILEWTNKSVAKLAYTINDSQCHKVLRQIMKLADKFDLKKIKDKGV